MWGAIIGSAISAGASYLGQRSANKSAEDIAAQNIALQREFARNGIQWKVEDAQKAGVHPLYALSSSTPSFSPVSSSFTNPMSGIADASQDIGRAIDAGMNKDDRYRERLKVLQVQRGELENQLLMSRIRRLEAQVPPPVPTGKNGVEVLPIEPVKHDSSERS